MGIERPVSFYFSGLAQYEFAYYASGFLEAARTLRRSIRRRKGHRNIDIAPVLFLYRHAIELSLKSIIILAERSPTADGAADEQLFTTLRTHKFSPLLSRVEKAFRNLQIEWWWPHPEIETLEKVRNWLRDLESVDPDSFAFRYPVTAKGRRSIPTSVMFTLSSVVGPLDSLAEALGAAESEVAVRTGWQ